MSELDALSQACIPVRSALGWRRARDASVAITRILTPLVPQNVAQEIAEAMTGEEPLPFLSVGETVRRLRKHGIKLSRHGLYRLARRAPGGRATYIFDANGNWDAADACSNREPFLRVSVVRDKCGFTRFIVRDLPQHKF